MNEEHPITVSLIREESLKRDGNPGTTVHETWAGLVRWVAWPIESDHKDCGGFVLAHLRDGIRRKTHVITTSALGIDYDEGKVTAQEAHSALANACHIIYSTWSSTDDAPRWRAILPYSRPVTGDEHRAIYATAIGWCAEAGIPIDPSTSDPCRLWYIPAKKPGVRFDCFVGNGPILDVDRVLLVAQELAADVAAERDAERVLRPRPPLPDAGDKRANYVRGAIKRACENVATASAGMRHGVLNTEAYGLARPELALSQSDLNAARDALEHAALTSMGDARAGEIRRTLRDAFAARGIA